MKSQKKTLNYCNNWTKYHTTLNDSNIPELFSWIHCFLNYKHLRCTCFNTQNSIHQHVHDYMTVYLYRPFECPLTFHSSINAAVSTNTNSCRFINPFIRHVKMLLFTFISYGKKTHTEKTVICIMPAC